MMFFDASFLFHLLRGKVIYRIRGNSQSIFLTFDDGPHPESTPALLELLERYQVKATFFCTGKNVERYPGVFEDILKRGHTVGNHTYSHLDGWKVSCKRYYDDVQKAHKLIQSRFFRPPYGHLTPCILKHLKTSFSVILWNNMPGDFRTSIEPEKLKKRILRSRDSRGSIVVLHDSPSTVPLLKSILSDVIQSFMNDGCQLRKLDESIIAQDY